MIRSLMLVLAFAAAPAWAAGPGFTILGAQKVGVPELPALTWAGPCAAFGTTTIGVTFTDPDGIAYAAVRLGAVAARPAVSDQAETWLWIPDYARPARGYQWRYEDSDGRLYLRYTLPVQIDLVPGTGPIWTEVIAKDGSGAMTIRRFGLVPDACR